MSFICECVMSHGGYRNLRLKRDNACAKYHGLHEKLMDFFFLSHLLGVVAVFLLGLTFS